MTLVGAFVVCLVSAMFPLVNAEAYVAGVATLDDGADAAVFALVAGLGQTCGKAIFYQVGRTSRSWRWARHKTASRRWRVRLDAWESRIQGRRWVATCVIALSALFGLPPLAVISVLAGRTHFAFPLFVALVLTGRTLRFAAVFLGADALGSMVTRALAVPL